MLRVNLDPLRIYNMGRNIQTLFFRLPPPSENSRHDRDLPGVCVLSEVTMQAGYDMYEQVNDIFGFCFKAYIKRSKHQC